MTIWAAAEGAIRPESLRLDTAVCTDSGEIGRSQEPAPAPKGQNAGVLVPMRSNSQAEGQMGGLFPRLWPRQTMPAHVLDFEFPRHAARVHAARA